jgi:hypothetical protein
VAGLVAAAATLLAYGLLNLLHARAHGALATQGPDLWFYLLVARGWEPLPMLDVTRLLVAPAALFSTAAAKAWLLTLAAACNAGCAFVLAARLDAFLPAAPRTSPGLFPRIAAGLAFALLPHNVAISVASFTHYTVGQLCLLGALQGLLPWLQGRAARPSVVGLLCLAAAAVVGPEGVLVAAWVAAWFAWRSLAPPLRARARRGVLLGAAACVGLAWLGYEPAFRAWARAVHATRGIDLLWQRESLSGDLLPLGFSFVTVFHGANLLWVALAAWALRKGPRPVAWLALALAALSLRVFRPAFLLQLTGALLLFAAISAARRPARAWAAALATSLCLAVLPLPDPVFPHYLAAAARHVGRSLPASSRVACSPTYGFFLEAWTGRHATATMHRRNPLWAELASAPPRRCAARMREAGIGCLWLTSRDFRLTPEGYWSSSGLQEALRPLPEGDFEDCVVVRAALARNLAPLRVQQVGGRDGTRLWWISAE